MIVRVRRVASRLAVASMLCLASAACGDAARDPEPIDPSPEELDKVFPLDRIPHLEFQFADGFDAVEKEFLESGSMEYWPASCTFDGEELGAVGVRIKGKVKYGAGKQEKKYSLKMNVDYFGAQRLHGVDSLHLLNNKPDPTAMREILASRMYAAMKVPVSRAALATVDVDGSPFGLYTSVQEVDKSFLKVAIGTESHADDGNLYKCVAPGCSLTWRGGKKSDYFVADCEEDNGCGLVLKTNEEDPALNDYADLVEFLDVVNNTDDGDFAEAIQEVFDVDSFLRFLAVAVVISDYEGYLGALNGFYLYHRPDNGKWVFIPWDHNQSYGVNLCKNYMDHTGNGLDPPWCPGSKRPLGERILAVDTFRDQYLAYVDEVLSSWFTPEQQALWIDELDQVARKAATTDPNSYHTADEYLTGISDDGSEWDPMNLMEFVYDRRFYLETLR